MTAVTPASVPERQQSPELDLTASTAEEFLAVLRRALHASGMTAGQLAKMADIPRSTAYRLVSPSNSTLPARIEQVERFARACGLRDDQIAGLKRTWHELTGTAHTTDDEEAPDIAAETATAVYQLTSPVDIGRATFSNPAEQGWNYYSEQRSDQEPGRRWMDRQLLDLLKHLTRESGSKRAKGGAGQAPIIIYNTHKVRSKSVTADRQAPLRSWAFRRQILALLVMALHPVLLRGIFGAPQQTMLLYVSSFGLGLVALMLLPQLGRPTVAPSPIRLLIALGVGAAAGGLAWLATTWLFIALLVGFLVFMTVPMWLAVMHQMWTGLLTSSRGVFTTLLAAWFGVLTGVFLITEHGPVAGAVLAGTLTAAGVLMEAVARIMPRPKCSYCETPGNQQPD